MGGAAAGAAAAIAQATKASGVIVRVGPADFQRILARQTDLLVVAAQGGFVSRDIDISPVIGGSHFSAKPLSR